MRAWSLAWNTADATIGDCDIVQVRRTGKGCLSYIVTSQTEAVVIDASVDPDVYVRLLAEREYRLVAVVDTHLHADHLSRSRLLAQITGADLFMGFILGPVLRAMDIRSRTVLIAFLVPRTLLYFPMVSLTAATAGWFLAEWFGFVDPNSSMHQLVVVSLALVTVMTVLGLGFLLPNSVRIWKELRRPEPDRERIVRINRINIWLAGTQGLLQIAIILVMAGFVT